jgi:outer membrane protein OmpA-like peptidoglycan-associated protein
MKSLFFIVVYLLSTLFSFSQRIKKDKLSLYYKTDVYNLSGKQKEEITNFIEYYKDTKIYKIVIIGSADFMGTNNYNLNLSKKRALKVSSFIKDNYSLKVKIKALGEQRNPYSYKPNQGISQHRKTTIICEYILPKSKSIKQSYKNTKKNNYLNKIAIIKKNNTFRLRNINFNYGKSTLTKSSSTELNNLLQILRKNPNLIISLDGHVCCGTSKLTEYDITKYTRINLSTKRAKKVHDYLLSKGIDSTRLSYKGYEFTKPIYYPERNERHKYLNRRVEVKIIEN